MPELPEVTALVEQLRARAVGRTVERVDVAAPNALKTADPPIDELRGRVVTGAARYGKYMDVRCDGWHLVVHFARAGWLRWRDRPPARPPKPGRGPIALRTHLIEGDTRVAFDLTEAGTQKNLAVWVVDDPARVPGIARLGPDPLEVDRASFGALLRGRTTRVHMLLTDQSVLAGIGNACVDEVLHAAGLSPFASAGKLSADAVDAVHQSMRRVVGDAVRRALDADPERVREQLRSGTRVHGRTGESCQVCADTVREVSYAEHSLQYCPTCQTGGRVLADRRMSRLLK